eukprot:3939542-Rhodomonas_salina.1
MIHVEANEAHSLVAESTMRHVAHSPDREQSVGFLNTTPPETSLAVALYEFHHAPSLLRKDLTHELARQLVCLLFQETLDVHGGAMTDTS